MRFERADVETISAVCLTLCGGGVVLGDGGRSVGPWSTAVPGRWAWAVIGPQGQALVLAHDAFEAARWFCRLEAEEVPQVGVIFVDSDAHQANVERWENWRASYRFAPVGEPGYEPLFPYEGP